MTVFVWNLLLALIWTAGTGDFTLGNLLVGFTLGYFVLLFAQRVIGPSAYFSKVRHLLNLAVFLTWEMITANLNVAYHVLTPNRFTHPGIVAVPLDARSDEEITMLSALITLTPGTLALDVSADRQTLYVHVLSLRDPDSVRQRVKQEFERRVLEVLR